MAASTYTIERFIGIDQSGDENMLSPCFSPDCMNMDTSDGRLTVSKGYSKMKPSPIEGTGNVDRLFLFKGTAGTKPVAVIREKVYAYDEASQSWESIYNYGTYYTNTVYDGIMTRIGTTDYLVIADGKHQMIKYDGVEAVPFGSEENSSDIPVNYVAMYSGRLFAAGDAEHPNRLYYSQLPGGDRSIENWGYVEASPTVEGGHAEVGSTGGDPITAIAEMSNQLLIFKKNSLYRLIGDRPSNFVIERVEADMNETAHTAIAEYGDVIYYVDKNGMHYYNGVNAGPMSDMRRIKRIMENADVSRCRAAVAGDTLFFTVKIDEEDRLIEYDLVERRYMQRGGFEVNDIMNIDGSLVLMNSKRYLYRLNDGDTYDGDPVEAYWRTPLTDLHDKASVKSMRELYLRGTSDEAESAILVDIMVGKGTDTYRFLLPENENEVLEIPLINEGRTMCMKLYNEAGGHFSLCGGVELAMSLRRRTE